MNDEIRAAAIADLTAHADDPKIAPPVETRAATALCEICGDTLRHAIEPHWSGWLDESGDQLSYSPTLHDHVPQRFRVLRVGVDTETWTTGDDWIIGAFATAAAKTRVDRATHVVRDREDQLVAAPVRLATCEIAWTAGRWCGEPSSGFVYDDLGGYVVPTCAHHLAAMYPHTQHDRTNV